MLEDLIELLLLFVRCAVFALVFIIFIAFCVLCCYGLAMLIRLLPI